MPFVVLPKCERFIEITEAVNNAADDHARAVAEAYRRGYLEAVNAFHPESSASGHLLICADLYYINQGYEGPLWGGLKQ
jgi:hypothetical protein